MISRIIARNSDWNSASILRSNSVTVCSSAINGLAYKVSKSTSLPFSLYAAGIASPASLETHIWGCRIAVGSWSMGSRFFDLTTGDGRAVTVIVTKSGAERESGGSSSETFVRGDRGVAGTTVAAVEGEEDGVLCLEGERELVDPENERNPPGDEAPSVDCTPV